MKLKHPHTFGHIVYATFLYIYHPQRSNEHKGIAFKWLAAAMVRNKINQSDAFFFCFNIAFITAFIFLHV